MSEPKIIKVNGKKVAIYEGATDGVIQNGAN
jgi:hypothetical protein